MFHDMLCISPDLDGHRAPKMKQGAGTVPQKRTTNFLMQCGLWTIDSHQTQRVGI